MKQIKLPYHIVEEAGQCEVKSIACHAERRVQLVIQVEDVAANKMISVCKPCVEEMIGDGEWVITDDAIQFLSDITVKARGGTPLIEIFTKKLRQKVNDKYQWAKEVRNNILTHGGNRKADYFMLSVSREEWFLWNQRKISDINRLPDYNFNLPEWVGNVEDWVLNMIIDHTATDTDWYIDSGLITAFEKSAMHRCRGPGIRIFHVD
jgi:hypothetical protein